MSDPDSESKTSDWSGRPNDGAADDVTLDRAFGLLSDQQRRHVLAKLYRTDAAAVSVDDLADHVLAYDPGASDRERVLVGLHHDTLPPLADDGIVDFDKRTGTVRYRGGELVDVILATLVEDNGTVYCG